MIDIEKMREEICWEWHHLNGCACTECSRDLVMAHAEMLDEIERLRGVNAEHAEANGRFASSLIQRKLEVERLRANVERLEKIVADRDGGEPISMLEELDRRAEEIEQLKKHQMLLEGLCDNRLRVIDACRDYMGEVSYLAAVERLRAELRKAPHPPDCAECGEEEK